MRKILLVLFACMCCAQGSIPPKVPPKPPYRVSEKGCEAFHEKTAFPLKVVVNPFMDIRVIKAIEESVYKANEELGAEAFEMYWEVNESGCGYIFISDGDLPEYKSSKNLQMLAATWSIILDNGQMCNSLVHIHSIRDVIIRHELYHAAGLDHAGGKESLMYTIPQDGSVLLDNGRAYVRRLISGTHVRVCHPVK
jgi:hypothetical protein